MQDLNYYDTMLTMSATLYFLQGHLALGYRGVCGVLFAWHGLSFRVTAFERSGPSNQEHPGGNSVFPQPTLHFTDLMATESG